MKAICLMLFSILTATILSAQTSPKFGLKAGLNVSTINWDIDGDTRLGFYAGGLAHIHLNPEWAIQPEIVYSQEGVKSMYNGEKFSYKTDYINIPVMVQYMFSNGFRVEAGPQLGVLVHSKTENVETGNEQDNEDVFNSTNISIGLGLNYLTYSGIGIGARYNLGLNKITEDGYVDGKGRTFQVGLFYLFKHSHKATSK